MRRAGLLALSLGLATTTGACGLLGSGSDISAGFEPDLQLAIADPKKAPDADDDRPVGFGGCDIVETRRLDLHVTGLVNEHRKTTIRGSLYVSAAMGAGALRRTKVAAKEDDQVRVVLLPALGRGAFLVIDPRSPGVPPADQPAAGAASVSVDDTSAPRSFPATAYWQRGSTLYSVSATRDGARLDESQRATARLAELVDRRPVRDFAQ